MAKNKIDKINIMFMAHYQDDAALLHKFYQYTKTKYSQIYRAFYDRICSFLWIEIPLTFAKPLSKEVIKEISEYTYRRHIMIHSNRWYKRFIFDLLGMAYFIKYYIKLKKQNIHYLFIYDDQPITNKACIMAARSLNIYTSILYQGYKNGMILIDKVGTRWESSIPHNKEFYLTIGSKRQTASSVKNNIVLVLLQKDDSPESILYAPIISKQSELLQLITEVAQQLIRTQFVIFNSAKKMDNIHNITYIKEEMLEFLPYAKAVITINNHEALKALDFEIPIISFGNTFFNIDGIAVTPKSKEHLINILENPNPYYNKEMACRFMNYIDTQSVAIHSMYNAQESCFEDILNK